MKLRTLCPFSIILISLNLPTGSIVALKESAKVRQLRSASFKMSVSPVVEIMILVSLEMVLPSAVRGCRTDQEVDPVPHEGKGCGVDKEGRAQTAVIIEMLHWMHGQS